MAVRSELGRRHNGLREAEMDQARHDLPVLGGFTPKVQRRMVFARQILADDVSADILAPDPVAQIADVEGRVFAAHDVCLSSSDKGARKMESAPQASG